MSAINGHGASCSFLREAGELTKPSVYLGRRLSCLTRRRSPQAFICKVGVGAQVDLSKVAESFNPIIGEELIVVKKQPLSLRYMSFEDMAIHVDPDGDRASERHVEVLQVPRLPAFTHDTVRRPPGFSENANELRFSDEWAPGRKRETEPWIFETVRLI